jgi:hypothetical protein
MSAAAATVGVTVGVAVVFTGIIAVRYLIALVLGLRPRPVVCFSIRHVGTSYHILGSCFSYRERHAGLFLFFDGEFNDAPNLHMQLSIFFLTLIRPELSAAHGFFIIVF